MAIGAIEIAAITRSQDLAAIKHNEDGRGHAMQTSLVQQQQRAEDRKAHEVQQSDDAKWHSRQPDAREKGNGEYSGDGGQRRKKKPVEQVVVKGRGSGFDIKI